MSENAIRGNTHFIRYTRKEIRRAWSTSGQGHIQAKKRGQDCVIIPCRDKGEATVICAMFIRDLFAIPTCTHWGGRTVSLFCGHTGGSMVESLKLKAALLGRLASESKPPAVPSDLFVGK